jgi:hypothetical protein
MEVRSRLSELTTLHPRLLWEDIIASAAAVLNDGTRAAPFRPELTVEGVSTFDDPSLVLTLDPGGVPEDRVLRLRRTYEASRLVELAAIAIGGLAIFLTGHLEMRDLALRGSRADYLVGEAG